MNVQRRALAGVLGLLFVFLACVAIPTVVMAEPAQSDSFTAVAGTDDVVMDKRAKNNAVLASGVTLAVLGILVAGALSHAKTRQKTDVDDTDKD